MDVKNQMMQLSLGGGPGNKVFRTILGVGAAAVVAVSSYSMGASTGSTSALASGSDAPVTSVLIGNGTSGAADGRAASAAKVSDPSGVPISEVIENAKASDAAGFASKLEMLKASPEFSGFLISEAGSVEAGGGEGLAAALTKDQVKAFVASIKGKSFEVITGKDGKQSVALTTKKTPQSGASVRTASVNSEATITTAGWSGPSCWQGWFAAGGYAAATGAICGAVGAMSAGIGGAACGAGAWAFGTGINWNDACR
ncbi:hypothetical protein ACFUOZ_21110 [Paenarthrobacter sp. NPDC057355]|uniref:hypothetical protein n=1 Tax=Paenarthrobacter sp. NPDC057355 TaxID=3346105 RepID=UPI00363744A4